MKKIFFIIFLFISTSALAQAICPLNGKPLQPKAIKSYEVLKRLPILDNGRLKPLDTYARNLLIQFSGKDTYERKPAIAWLAAVLFAPDATKEDAVFLINNPDIATALGIEPSHNRHYAFKQIEKAYPKLLELEQAAQNIPEKQRSIVESEIIRVFENFRLYAELSYEFMFAFPHQDFTIDSADIARTLGLPADQEQFSFLDIAIHAQDIRTATAGLEQVNQALWSDDQKQILRVMSNLFYWSLNYKDLPLGLIPSSTAQGEWLSPWDAIAKDFKNDGSRQMIMLWRNMVIAYWNGEQIEFDLAGRLYLETIVHHLGSSDLNKLNEFPLELAYHAWRPFLIAKIFYIFALVFFVASFMSTSRWWYGLAWGAIMAGFIPHVLGLISRIIIMARPPVTNLYETFIFVSAITVLLGILIERFNKQWLGIVVAGVSGTALLFIASKYGAEGDTLKMLIAVLNSNFWLSTHVTTITMGYGATCVAGILGHIWLLQAASKKQPEILNNTYMVMMGILGLALTLTFLGTNLGGIWADQSWGRFWGWDPKENGALMIVLWSAMLFHAHIAKMIGMAGMAAGCVLDMVVVMWAWFGVNLLSIGLHSYGFTSGIANTLLIYVFCEIIFLAVTLSLVKRSK